MALRRWSPADADAVFRACQDEQIQRWTTVPVPYTRGDAEWFVGEHSGSEWSSGQGASCALVTSATGELVGSMGVNAFRDGTAEIGYWTVPGMRGRGYTAEGLQLLADWAIDERDVARVQLLVEVSNTASRATAERAGFTCEGVLRSALLVRGVRADAAMFSLLPGDRE